MPQELNQKNIFSWSAPEFIYARKTTSWFLTFFVAAAGFFIIALFMQNYIFALIILLAAFLIAAQAVKKPKAVKFGISEEGFMIDEKIYLWQDIKSFWIFEEPEIRAAILETKKMSTPRLHIPLAQQNAQILREILRKHIPEKKLEESLTDIIARRLKF